jgi:small subunit ribosomal protein S2
MFVIDTNKEAIAILEARKLNIPVVAILDTNCDPDGITYPIPGNDDAARALQLYCDLIADAVLDGLAAGQANSGVDLGASVAPIEPTLARQLTPEPVAEAAAPEVAAAEVAEQEAAFEAAAAPEAPAVEAAPEAAQEATAEAIEAVAEEPAAS